VLGDPIEILIAYTCENGNCIPGSDRRDWLIEDCSELNKYCVSDDATCAQDCPCLVDGWENISDCEGRSCSTYNRKGTVGVIKECDGCFQTSSKHLFYVGGGFACPSNSEDSCNDHDCLDGYCDNVIGPCLGNNCVLPSSGTNQYSCCFNDNDCVSAVTEPNVCSGGDLYDWENDFSCQDNGSCGSLRPTKYCQAKIGSGRMINKRTCSYGCVTESGWGNDHCKPAPSNRSCSSSCSGTYNRVTSSNSCGGYVISTCIGSWTFDAVNWSSSCSTNWESTETYTHPSSIPCN